MEENKDKNKPKNGCLIVAIVLIALWLLAVIAEGIFPNPPLRW